MKWPCLAICHASLLVLLLQMPVMATNKEGVSTSVEQASTTAAASPAMSIKSSAIPFKRENVQETSLSTGLLAVLLLGGAAFAVVTLLRKNPRFFPQKHLDPHVLSILTTQHLGPRTSLYVIEFSGVRHLLVQSEHGIQCLASVPSKPPGGSNEV